MDVDLEASWTVTHRVIHQVRDHLTQAFLVGDRADIRRAVHAPRGAGRVGLRRDQARDGRAQRHDLKVEGQTAGIGQRQLLEIVDEAFEQPHLVLQRREPCSIGRDELLLHRLELRLQVRHRRAQFVADIRDDLTPQALSAGNGLSSLVERIGKFDELGRATAPPSLRPPSGMQIPRGVDKMTNRPQRPAHHPDRSRHRDDENTCQPPGRRLPQGPRKHRAVVGRLRARDDLLLAFDQAKPH